MTSLRSILQSRIGRVIGGVASALCLVVFLILLERAFSSEQGRFLLAEHWRALIGAFCLYALAYLPMLAAWIVLAEASGCRPAWRELACIFLISQAAKYLPGNVGQFIGRAYAGETRGFPLSALAKAMALELASILAAAGLLASAAFALGSGGGSAAFNWSSSVALALASCCGPFGAALLFRGRIGRSSILRPAILAVCCYCAVLMLVATANVVLVSANAGLSNWALAFSVGGAFLVSWLVGFVTPGAPAGLGVRELAFCSLLAGVVPSEALILAAAGFRLVTTCGDLIAWTAGMAIRNSPRGEEAALST